jgi:hypothetical protein
MYFKCTFGVYMVHFDVFIIYLNVFEYIQKYLNVFESILLFLNVLECIYGIFQCIWKHLNILMH